MYWWQRRKPKDEEIERELQAHLELEAAEQQERGLAPEDARCSAKRAFGNPAVIKEDIRQGWTWVWLERAKQDLSYALRLFKRAPGFTTVVILTLALGIGATTAIFSIVNAVLLHPLPYRNSDRLVVIWEKVVRNPNGPPVFDSYRDFEGWKRNSSSFEHLAPATWATGQAILTGAGRAKEVLAMPVGIDFFPMLGIAPELGRTFQPDDLHRGCTVVLQHQFWKTVLNGQRDVIGKHIALSETPCTIIGVMPKKFTFYPSITPMWTLITPDNPIARDPENANFGNANVGVFGLLKPGVSLQSAQRDVTTLYRNMHRQDPPGTARQPVVYPLAEQFAYLTGPSLRLSIVVLFAAVIVVLLIACVNIANLLLGRSLVRQKELAVRAALGSDRKRLIRQLLTEGLLLSLAGAALGTLLAWGAVQYFRAVNPIALPPGNPVRIDGYVLGFTAFLAIATAVACGLTPAIKASRVDLIDALRASARGASLGPAAQALGTTLVVVEVMFSLVLLVGAGLLIDSLTHFTAVPLGFRTDRVSVMPIVLPKWNYSKDNQRLRFYREILERATVLPGVEGAAFASSLPLNFGRWGASSLTVKGRPEPKGEMALRDVAGLSITPQYFRVMDVPLKGGRLFDNRDRPENPAVAIVNEALVRQYFPHANPLGQQVRLGEAGANSPWLTVIGIAADEKDINFFHQMSWQDIPLVFRPVAQDPPLSGSLVVRVANGQINIGAALEKQVAAVDSGVPVGELQPMNERLSHALAYPRFRAVLLGMFAGLALLLAAVGLYGVLSQAVARRIQEFGIRIALGASKQDILLLVIRQTLVCTVAGLTGGLLIASVLTRFLSSLLYDVTPTDPWILLGVSFLFAAVAIVAASFPAWRAIRVDPVVALRYE